MALDITQLRRCNWNVTYNSVDLGGVDSVEPDIELITEPIKVGTVGVAELGSRFVGANILIKVQARQITRAIIEKLIPWSGSAGAAIDLAPPINTDLYTYAQVLLLHPTDAGNTAQDISFTKAVPTRSMSLKRDGENDDLWDLVFKCFPDRSQLPALKYGTVTA
jgi:hypothetical protein